MERATESEYDVELLGSRSVVRSLKLLQAGTLVLYLSAWGMVTAAIILDGKSDHFEVKEVLKEWQPYHWSHTSADAVIASFLCAVIASTAAINHRPAVGMLASVAVGAAAVVKRGMLSEPAGHLRALASTFSAAACCALALASLAQLTRARRQRASSAEVHLAASSNNLNAALMGPHLDSYSALEGYARKSGQPARGTSVGRLLTLSRPERCLLTIATFALFGSTASSMAMPALIGKLLPPQAQAQAQP